MRPSVEAKSIFIRPSVFSAFFAPATYGCQKSLNLSLYDEQVNLGRKIVPQTFQLGNEAINQELKSKIMSHGFDGKQIIPSSHPVQRSREYKLEFTVN